MGKKDLGFSYWMATRGMHVKDPSRSFHLVGIDTYDDLEESKIENKKYERRKLKTK